MPRRKVRQPPPVGSKYKKVYRGNRITMIVVSTDKGVGFKVGGKVYASPSGAAKSITGGEVNGWRFWGIEN